MQIAWLIWLILSAIVVMMIGLRLKRVLTPSLRLSVTHRWLSDTMVLIRLEVENTSRVTVEPHTKLLQMLEHDEDEELSEFVRLSENDTRGETPLSWRDPVNVLETTKEILPLEHLIFERLHKCPPGRMLHVLLQIQRKPPPDILRRVQRWLSRTEIGWPDPGISWTTTVILRRDQHQSA